MKNTEPTVYALGPFW